MNSIIEVNNLSFTYAHQDTLLKDLSFKVPQGAFLAIVGPNGVGKTTLLNLLCGLLHPETGAIKIDSIYVESYSARKLAQKIAVVRQEFVPVFDFTVTEIASMARAPYLGTFGFESEADKQIVTNALEITDTAHFASRSLAELSAGERQRVFIARALAQQTPLLLLDEPTSFLDLRHQVGIYDLLKRMQLEKDKTIVAVTHDVNLAAQYCDQILLLGADNSYRIGKAGDVFSQSEIAKAFGVSTFAGEVGQERFFLPLGTFAKDANLITTNCNPHKKNKDRPHET